MSLSSALRKGRGRLFPTLALAAVILLASWMGAAHGGYFINVWALVVFVLAALLLFASVTGVAGRVGSPWTLAAVYLFAAHAGWSLFSILWSPDRGDALYGAGLTLLYLVAFWVTATFIAQGASRRWVLATSVLGAALVAALTLSGLGERVGELFENSRLVGSLGYYNSEAAFLLIPFWVGVYLAGSRGFNPVLRGACLAGATLCLQVAVLTQSRGALVALFVSLPIFFLLSGKRLRGLISLVPVAAALLVTFPALNGIYQELLEDGSPAAAIEQAVPAAWAAAAGAGLYGLLWGLADRMWSPPEILVRIARVAALAGVIFAVVAGGFVFAERVGNPVAWGQEQWQAFRTDDTSGEQQSRYLSASGSGRFVLWEVAVEDFVSNPLLGVGTHNYEATYYQERDQQVGYVRQPHSLPLGVLAERGLVGGILFFGFLGTCLLAGLWRRFTVLGAESKARAGALVAAITYWFVHSSAEWFWQIPAVTLPAMVYLAMLITPGRVRPESEEPGERPASSGWTLRAAGAGVAVLAVLAVAPLYVSNLYLQQSQATDNPLMALQSTERAQNINPLAQEPVVREAELAEGIGNFPRAEQSYEKSIQLDPEHYASYVRLAQFYERRGETEEVLEAYRKALERNPMEQSLQERVEELERESGS